MTTASAPIPIANASPDYLAGALLQHLSRPHHHVRIGGMLRGLIVAVITFGAWPLLRWPKRLGDLVLIQRNQLWHLAEWVRLHGGHGDADKLRRAVERVRFRLGLWLMSLILLAGAAAEIGFISHTSAWDGRTIVRSLYSGHLPSWPTRTPNDHAQLVWIVALSAAYALHWAQVQLHARDVRRVVRAFNVVGRGEGISPLPLPRAGIGIGMGWMAAAAVLCLLGAWWGIAMGLAAGAQMHLADRQMPRLRARLAEALRRMLAARRPSMAVPAPVLPSRRCGNDTCRHSLPAAARFCPRCGQPAA